MDHIKSVLKENLGLTCSRRQKIEESILLDEGIKDLAKKGFKILGKTKNVAKSLIKSTWRPAVLLILAAGAAFAGDGDFSPYIDKLNTLFSSASDIDPSVFKSMLSLLVDALHSSNIPLEDAQQIVDQVEVFKNAGENVDSYVDIVYQAKSSLGDIKLAMGEEGASGGSSTGGTSGGTTGSTGGTSSSSDGGTTTGDVGSTPSDSSDSDSSDSESTDSKYPVGIGGVFRTSFNKKYKCPKGFKKRDKVCVPKDSKLTEEPIGDVSHKMNIKVLIDKSVHAGERQSRHSGQYIDDQQIRSVAHRATKKMINDMIYDKIDIGQEIHIKDSKSDLNIIGVMKDYKGQLVFKVITVMNKPNFYPKKGTISIEV